MKIIHTSIVTYHLPALAWGVVFFFASNHGFNYIGMHSNDFFDSYRLSSEQISIAAAINIIVAFLGSLLPAVILVIIIHYLIRPKTMLFLVSMAISYLALSIWSALDLVSMTNGTSYILGYTCKAIGSLLALWLFFVIYFKVITNKASISDMKN